MNVTFLNGKYTVKFTSSEQALVSGDEQKFSSFLLDRLVTTWLVQRRNVFDGMTRVEVENKFGTLPSAKQQQVMALLRG